MAVASLLVETDLPIMMTCIDGAGIEKGTLLKMTTPLTAAACTADNEVWAGVAAEEKISGDGKTKIAVYVRGIFGLTAGGAGITVGKPVSISGANAVVDSAAGDNDLGYCAGKALETGAVGVVCAVFVGLI